MFVRRTDVLFQKVQNPSPRGDVFEMCMLNLFLGHVFNFERASQRLLGCGEVRGKLLGRAWGLFLRVWGRLWGHV